MNTFFKPVAALLVALTIQLPVYGQSHSYFDSLDIAKAEAYEAVRSQYIKEYHDHIYIKPILTIRNLRLELQDANNQEDDIVYRPSSNNYFGFGIYAFDLNMELSFKLPQDQAEIPSEVFGETKAFDFQTNIYSKKWGADIAFQNYAGLYLDKPSRHYPGYQAGDPYPIRNDLSMRYFQLNAFYLFNHSRFSFRSPYVQSERQLKHAGSFMAGLFVSTFRFNADSTLIPETARPTYASNEELKEARVTTLALLPGYSHTFNYKMFYVNGSLSLGPGHLWLKYNEGPFERENIQIRPVFNLRAALGYNGDRFFGGITTVYQVVSAGISNLEVNSASGNVKIFLGLRIREKGIFKKNLFSF